MHKETSVSGQKMKTKHAKFPLASASHPVTKTKTKILPQDQDPGQNFGLKARKEGRDWHLEASVISGLMSLYSSECICNLQLNNVLERTNTGMSRDVAFLVPYKSTCVLLESKRQRPIWCRVWSSELDLCHVPYDKLRVASAAAGLTSSVRYPKTFGLRRTTKKGLITPIDYSVCPISIVPVTCWVVLSTAPLSSVPTDCEWTESRSWWYEILSVLAVSTAVWSQHGKHAHFQHLCVFGPHGTIHMRLLLLWSSFYLYILNTVRCPYVHSSVTLGMASWVANDVIVIIAGL